MSDRDIRHFIDGSGYQARLIAIIA